VTIHPLFRKSSLGPEEIEVLAGAYNDALKQLGLSRASIASQKWWRKKLSSFGKEDCEIAPS
jgi:hypothetical protein